MNTLRQLKKPIAQAAAARTRRHFNAEKARLSEWAKQTLARGTDAEVVAAELAAMRDDALRELI